MKHTAGIRFGVFTMLALGAWLCLPASASHPRHRDCWLAENAALDARYVEALGKGDIDGLMACFSDSPDVLFVAIGGKILQGKEAIRAFFMAQPPANKTSEGFNVRYWKTGDLVFAVGSVVITVHYTDGRPPFTFTDVWSDVRRKEKGRWVYLVDHATMVPH